MEWGGLPVALEVLSSGGGARRYLAVGSESVQGCRHATEV